MNRPLTTFLGLRILIKATKIIQSSLEACQNVKIIRRTLYSLLFQLLNISWPQSAIAFFSLRLASSWKLLSPSSQTISHPPEKPSLTFLEGKTVWFDRTINHSSKLSCHLALTYLKRVHMLLHMYNNIIHIVSPCVRGIKDPTRKISPCLKTVLNWV